MTRQRTPEQLAALAEQLRQAGTILGAPSLIEAADLLLERAEPELEQLVVSYQTLAKLLDSDESYLRSLGRAGCWREIRSGRHWIRVDVESVRAYLRRHEVPRAALHRVRRAPAHESAVVEGAA